MPPAASGMLTEKVMRHGISDSKNEGIARTEQD